MAILVSISFWRFLSCEFREWVVIHPGDVKCFLGRLVNTCMHVLQLAALFVWCSSACHHSVGNNDSLKECNELLSTRRFKDFIKTGQPQHPDHNLYLLDNSFQHARECFTRQGFCVCMCNQSYLHHICAVVRLYIWCNYKLNFLSSSGMQRIFEKGEEEEETNPFLTPQS